ncbi:hypothetical protein [Zunongwangia sp.]|uniref:hypothetical protein n=1 Tax=Zunongwangia sp. TaxID=1965325 RepID=UPI003AA7DB70
MISLQVPSTEGILSLIYLCPDEQGYFKYGAKEALDIYLDQGDEIFDMSLGKKWRSLGVYMMKSNWKKHYQIF